MNIFKSLLKIFCAVIFLSIISACNFAPGSYPYAERYDLNYSEDKVKSAINQFKKEYPEYIVPKVTINNQGSLDLKDEPTVDPAHWYKFYFYYKNENKIIYTWTRPAGKNRTIFAFVRVNYGLNLGSWKDINRDYRRSENIEEKKKFEERILNKIKGYL